MYARGSVRRITMHWAGHGNLLPLTLTRVRSSLRSQRNIPLPKNYNNAIKA